MNKTPLKLREAIRIITLAAYEYEKNLNNRNFIFIFKNRTTNQIEYFESVFLSRNFQHLTGLDFLDRNKNPLQSSTYFYKKCLNKTLTPSEIRFKDDGTTELKLQALPLIVKFLKSSKMTAIYNSFRPKLAIERLVGTTTFCLGFKKDALYYVPSSCLLEDIRDLSDVTFQILAIFSKPSNKNFPIYKDICYVAKGVELSYPSLPQELSRLINLENYILK